MFIFIFIKRKAGKRKKKKVLFSRFKTVHNVKTYALIKKNKKRI